MALSNPPARARPSERLYRLLLLAYPRAFREQYAAEMLLVFRDAYRDAVAARRERWACSASGATVLGISSKRSAYNTFSQLDDGETSVTSRSPERNS